jgi:hypothetical protein
MREVMTMAKASFSGLIREANIEDVCYWFLRDWESFPASEWNFSQATRIPTPLYLKPAPTSHERLFDIHYHLNGLGGGFVQVYFARTLRGDVAVQIHEVTALEPPFVTGMLTKWFLDLGAVAGFPGKTSAPASAEIPQIDAGDTAIQSQSDDQAGAPLSIHDGLPNLGQGTPEDWNAIFEYLRERGIDPSKIDHGAIAQRTGRAQTTVERNKSHWRNGTWPRSYRKSKES